MKTMTVGSLRRTWPQLILALSLACQTTHTPDQRAVEAWRKAASYRELGQLDSSMTECQKAIAIDSLIPRPYQLRAYLLYRSGHPLAECINDMQHCLRLLNDSSDGSAHLDLAKYLHKAGRLHEAFQEYLETVRADSTFADGQIELANIYDFRCDTVAALTHYDRFLRYARPDDTLVPFAGQRIIDMNAPLHPR